MSDFLITLNQIVGWTIIFSNLFHKLAMKSKKISNDHEIHLISTSLHPQKSVLSLQKCFGQRMTLLLSGRTEELFLILSFDSEIPKLVTQSNSHVIKYKTDEQSFLFPSKIVCTYVAPLSTNNVIK